MFSNLSEEEKVVHYAVFGGTPYYLEKTLHTRIRCRPSRTCWYARTAPWQRSPRPSSNMRTLGPMRGTIQSSNPYGRGRTVLKEISDFTHVPATALPTYLARLDRLLCLIGRKDPVLGKERLKRYEISDNFFRFWYRFIFENQTAINMENSAFVQEKITGELNAYVGRLFEDVVRRLLGLLPAGGKRK